MRNLFKILLLGISSFTVVTQPILTSFSTQIRTKSMLNSPQVSEKDTTRLLKDATGGNTNDWDLVTNIVDHNLDQSFNVQTSGKKLPLETLQMVKNEAFKKINELKTSSKSLFDNNHSLINNNENLLRYYQHPEAGYSQQNDKIFHQYFGNKSVDLKLNGMQTYQDALNALTADINHNYPNNNWKISLSDQGMATKTLFDDKSSAKIIAFVNNQTRIAVDIKTDSKTTISASVQLTNIKFDNLKNSIEVYKCFLAYFDENNPQDLDLKINDSFLTIVSRLWSKINDRFNCKFSIFKQLSPTDKGIHLVFDSKNNDGYILSDKLDSNLSLLTKIFNHKLAINFTVFDYDLPSILPPGLPMMQSCTLAINHVKFDPNTMKETLKTIFNNQVTASSAQSLGLTTYNTLQEGLDKFNQSLNSFNQDNTFYFQTTLKNPSTANDKLQTQYNPVLPNNNFHLDVKLSFVSNQTITDLGDFRVYLGNVLLDNVSQKLKTTFNQLETTMTKIQTAKTVLIYLSTAVLIIAAAYWTIAALTFGSTTGEAIAATIAGSALVIMINTLIYILYYHQQQISNWEQSGLVISTLTSTCVNIVCVVAPCLATGAPIISLTTWAVPIIITAIGCISTLAACIALLPHKG